ncbi:alpha/beta fold hydrolase [Mycolicibacterium grossiae]|uniref:Alpha/beta hydrolase n=1 Tax=Mycolicibacterium grossiae TaxID=1552759 RepID=A0A1E8PWU2_9MYCO|nr:alpha/beta hydrolase [Mycolicibacterium grossiae]OFJ50735.1 alpha/beta hydrolase [Mycolicibacterium grossiae]QEM46362.1 alpha/beta hydrolase [Mycolicibacterium grossiae]
MEAVRVGAGTLEYREEGDPAGPPVVLLHGLLMNDTQWDLALPLLPSGFRYLLPVLPLGGHRIPMDADADLALRGMVGIVADFFDALDLDGVTLVVTDWGGPLFLTDLGRDQRVARLVICPSEAFDNFPPGFPGKVTWLATRTTGTAGLAMRQLRIRWLRDRFFMFGMMAARSIPQDVVTAWTAPGLADVRIRRDLLKYARTRFDAGDLVRATRRLADFRGDVLVLWSRNRVMPVAHAEALADLTGGTLRYVDDAKVLVMLDQPERTAREIGAFLTAARPSPR